jgi:alkylhydroperoxidase family enzyme
LARIPDFQPGPADTEKKFLQGKPPFDLNIFKIITHAPVGIAREFIGLPASVLMAGKLDPVLREMAITRAGILCNSAYEVHQHRNLSKLVGLPEEKIKALDTGSASPSFRGIESSFCASPVKPSCRREVAMQESDANLETFFLELTGRTFYRGCCYMAVSIFLITFDGNLEE